MVIFAYSIHYNRHLYYKLSYVEKIITLILLRTTKWNHQVNLTGKNMFDKIDCSLITKLKLTI